MIYKHLPYFVFRAICAAITLFLFRFKTTGKENIPPKGGFLIASNHTSYLDPVMVGVACPRRLNYMARHDLFNNPLFATILKACCVFPVKRNSADSDALKRAMRHLKNGEGLLLFPEGGRQSDVHRSKPEAGIGFLAAKAGVPVIPVFVSGTDRALPRYARFIRPAVKISVHFGKQIYIEGRMPYQDIAEKIMGNIRHLSC